MSSTAQRLLTGARARRDSGEAITATDGELLMRFRRSGDRQALTQILDRHTAMVWGVCRNVLHREQDAQDAFQATFLILLRRADSIRANDSAAGWLYRVALRAACDVRRTRLRRREEPLDAEPPQPEPAFPDIQRRQLAAALMEELQALPDKYQVPLVLRYLEGLSRREIAEQLDTTVASVQGLLVRGKRQLRSRLVRRGVSLSVAMGVITGARPTEAAPVGPVLSSGGAASAFSPVVQQLTASGVRSMMFAAYAKPVVLAATVAIAALLATTDEQSSLASTPASNLPVQLDATPVDADEEGAPAVVLPAVPFAVKNIEVDSNKGQTRTSDLVAARTDDDTLDTADLEAQQRELQQKQLDLELQHWQMREKSLQLRIEAANAMVEQQQRVREKVANSIPEHTIKDQQASALEFQAGLLEAQAKVLEVQRKLAAPPAPPLAPGETPPLTGPPQLTPASADLMKRQLDLELGQWRLKAQAFEQRAAAMEAEIARANEIRDSMPKSVAEFEIQKKQSDRMMIQAEALEAQARAVEMQRRMEELQAKTVKPKQAANSYSAAPALPTRAPLPQPTSTVAPPAEDYSLPLPQPANSSGKVKAGDRLVISRAKPVLESRVAPTGEHQLVSRQVNTQETHTVDAKGNLNLPRFHKPIPLEGRTVAEATQLLQELDPRFKSVEKFRQRKLDSGLAGPLVSASPAVDDQFDAMRRRLEEQGRVIEELQGQVGRTRTSVPDAGEQEGALRQGSWRTFYKPTEIAPQGWSVVAELADGQHMPAIAQMPAPRPYLRLLGKRVFGDRVDYHAFEVVDPGHPTDGHEVNSLEPFELRGRRVEAVVLGPGRLTGNVLVVTRDATPRGESGAAAPARERALELLYQRERDLVDARQLSQLREQATQLTEQRDQLREQVEAAKQQVQQAREEAAKQRAVAMQEAQQAMQEIARAREQLDQQRKELQRQAEMLKEQRKNEQGRGVGAENPAPAAGDESDNS